MQGLPSQILPKSSKTEVFGDKKVSANVEAGVEGKIVGGTPKAAGEGFASIFAGLTAKGKVAGKPSEVKSETGETLKNLLAQKDESLKGKEAALEIKQPGKREGLVTEKLDEKLEGKLESKSDKKLESQKDRAPGIDSKELQLLMTPVLSEKNAEKNNLKNVQGPIEEKLTNTTNNLDQFLNSLKGKEEPVDSKEINNEQLLNTHTKKNEIKGELKIESPLDFILKGTKSKDVGETMELAIPKDKKSEASFGSKNVMTGEDYLRSVETSDKKESGKLAMLNNMGDLQKNNVQNVKGYGMGLSLLSDPLIKNTKDLAFKEVKKGNSFSPIDELHTPESKVGAELSGIKQELIPAIQNDKNNHGKPSESQTQVNQKILDLSKINTANTTEIIKRISDYVEQNQVANKSSLDLTVKHDSLGEFKIQVSKMPSQSLDRSQNSIDMQITTSSKEGHDFFVKNEVSLMKNLNQAGINLSDFRIVSNMTESTPFGQSDSKQSSSFSQNPDGSEKQFMSFESNNFSSDSSHGSDRRKELWEEYQQRYGA